MRRTLIIVLALSSLLIAGCGGSSNKPKHTGHAAFLAFSECMRAHGVTNFPDPSGSGGIQLGPGINPTSPTFISAQKSCTHLLPDGGPQNVHPTKQAIAASDRMARCMRAHGVSGFPDPRTSPIGPGNVTHYAIVEDDAGVVIAIPATVNVQSPAFKSASQTCGFH